MVIAPITLVEAVTLLGVIFSLYIGLKKTPIEISKMKGERGKTKAEEVNIYAEATQAYAEEVVRLRAEIQELRTSFEQCSKEMKEALDQLNIWREYANVLAHQLRSHRIEPTPLEASVDVPEGSPIPRRPRRKPSQKETRE